MKCIYIDPPYNTGNEAWAYNDNVNSPMMQDWLGKVVDREDLTRHDKWCCMMLLRLKLLRELLSEDGAIFVSIDDNEVHRLRCLMDEVFGEENFVTTIVWQKVDGPKNTARHFSEDHEFLLVYARDAERWRPRLLPRSEEMLARYKNPDKDPRGPWLLSDVAARNYYAQGRYSITTPSGQTITGPPAGSYWRVSKERFKELENDNRIWWGRQGNNRPPSGRARARSDRSTALSRSVTLIASMGEAWVFAQRASWLRLLPMRAIWRLRSRSTARAGAVQVCVRAIACRSNAEGDTPAAAFSFQAAFRPRDTGGDHDGAPLSHERTGPGVRGTASPVRLLPRQRREKPGVRRGAQRPLARAQCLTLAFSGTHWNRIERQECGPEVGVPSRPRACSQSTVRGYAALRAAVPV